MLQNAEYRRVLTALKGLTAQLSSDDTEAWIAPSRVARGLDMDEGHAEWWMQKAFQLEDDIHRQRMKDETGYFWAFHHVTEKPDTDRPNTPNSGGRRA